MQSPSRYLRRMALFLAAVAVAAAVTFPILAHAFMVNPALNGLICGVVLVGVLYEFRQVLALGPELRGGGCGVFSQFGSGPSRRCACHARSVSRLGMRRRSISLGSNLVKPPA